MYRQIHGSRGTRYMKDGKLIKKVDVPPAVMAEFENKEEVTGKFCLFCDKLGTHTRFAQMQTVDLCEEHYYSRRMGEVVNRLKELQDA